MRGHVERQSQLFWTIDLEEVVPSDHPLRGVKMLCEEIFMAMRKDFNAAYSRMGRPGIPPEQILKALLLQALYSIPSEIKLMKAIRYNMLFRCFRFWVWSVRSGRRRASVRTATGSRSISCSASSLIGSSVMRWRVAGSAKITLRWTGR